MTAAFADEASDALIEQGIAQIEAGDPASAVDIFIQAYETDPADPKTLFYVGMGMNRAGDPVQAIAALDEAQRLGFAFAELDFEAGWALLTLGQYDLAIQRLEYFEIASPGRGKTSELLGRAWLAKGNTETAVAYFEQAIARDPSLRSSVEFQLAAIAVSEGDTEKAAAYLDSIVETDPASPLGQYLGQELRELAQAPAAEAEAKLWSIVASFAVGHDSNAIALGDSLPLPSDITNDSGAFAEAAVTGSVIAFSRPGIDQLSINGTVAGRRYGDNLSVVDSESLSGGLDYLAVIRRGLIGRVQAYLGTNLNHGEMINKYVGGRGSVQFESLYDVVLEPWASVTYTDFNEVGFVAPADQRSGPTDSLGLNGYWTWDALDLDLRGGGAYGNTDTKGTNFDNLAWTAFIGLNKELGDGVVADAFFMMTNSNYENLDTRATPPGSEKRYDRTRYFALQLSKPVWRNVTVFGRFDLTTNDSNIAAFTYDRVVTTAGLAASF